MQLIKFTTYLTHNYLKTMRALLLSLFITVFFAGCKKDDICDYDPCKIVAPAAEIQAVENYLSSNGITATKHCSGVYYIIESVGTGESPTICSFINANYVGKLTDGTVFDSGSFPQLYQLGGLIRGWVNTLPMIKQGGKIKLFIPPYLGYGGQATGPIPANSILIFDLELTVVQ